MVLGFLSLVVGSQRCTSTYLVSSLISSINNWKHVVSNHDSSMQVIRLFGDPKRQHVLFCNLRTHQLWSAAFKLNIRMLTCYLWTNLFKDAVFQLQLPCPISSSLLDCKISPAQGRGSLGRNICWLKRKPINSASYPYRLNTQTHWIWGWFMYDSLHHFEIYIPLKQCF